MNTSVALVNAYLRFNGYVAIPEQPVLVGEGRPYRYHTATDVDILAVRFPNAALVVPRGDSMRGDDDLQLDSDPILDLRTETVDVIIGEVKESRPRLNPALLERDVLYATLKRIDPGLDEPLENTIEKLQLRGEAWAQAGGRPWRFRLFAFGEGQPAAETGAFTTIQLSHAAHFLIRCMRDHHRVWRDAQFGDPVLDLLHLFDKLGLTWVANDEVAAAAERNRPVTKEGLQDRSPAVTDPAGAIARLKPPVNEYEPVPPGFYGEPVEPPG